VVVAMANMMALMASKVHHGKVVGKHRIVSMWKKSQKEKKFLVYDDATCTKNGTTFTGVS